MEVNLKNSGIYVIKNKINGKVYIGQARHFKRRWDRHKEAWKGSKNNPYLQHAYEKYGPDAFEFSVLEECECKKEILNEREQYWMDFYQSYNEEFGYNICKIAGSSLNTKHSQETKDKLSKFRKGKSFEEFYGEEKAKKIKEKLSSAASGQNNPMYGIHLTGTNNSSYGKPRTAECKDKLRQLRLGTKVSEDTKRKLSLMRRGQNNANAKLTQLQVDEIREKYSTRQYTQAVLAEEYCVSRSTICAVINFRAFRNYSDN